MLGLLMVTVTPGSAPPLVSTARPVMVPVLDCADAAAAVAATTISAAATRHAHSLIAVIDLLLLQTTRRCLRENWRGL
jgi:hypothetical protein